MWDCNGQQKTDEGIVQCLGNYFHGFGVLISVIVCVIMRERVCRNDDAVLNL